MNKELQKFLSEFKDFLRADPNVKLIRKAHLLRLDVGQLHKCCPITYYYYKKTGEFYTVDYAYQIGITLLRVGDINTILAGADRSEEYLKHAGYELSVIELRKALEGIYNEAGCIS